VKVIDVDPSVLQHDAEAALHAAEQSTIHIEAEFKDDIPNLISTLADQEPYAFISVWTEFREDGSVRIPVTTTRQGVFDGYTEMHKRNRLDTWLSLVELRGEWYTFVEGINDGFDRVHDVAYEKAGPTIGLFPVGAGRGITGELVWGYRPRAELGFREEGEHIDVSEPATEQERSVLREELLLLHERYLNALRAADVEGILNSVSTDAQAAIRNYVDDTGTLVNLEGRDAHRDYYRSLFEKYQIHSVDLLRRLAQHWYVFAEVRLVVSPKTGPEAGHQIAFNTAEYFVAGHNGRFLVRIGHGTDPA
jgi:hypothetical protein